MKLYLILLFNVREVEGILGEKLKIKKTVKSTASIFVGFSCSTNI